VGRWYCESGFSAQRQQSKYRSVSQCHNLGEEYAMIEQFIDYYCSKFTYDNKKNQLAVFVEPRISDKEILSRKFPAAGEILS
jgi:hypothetical protein